MGLSLLKDGFSWRFECLRMGYPARKSGLQKRPASPSSPLLDSSSSRVVCTDHLSGLAGDGQDERCYPRRGSPFRKEASSVWTNRSLLRAVADAGSDDPESVRRALSTVSDFEGVTGSLGYPAGDRIPRKAVSILEVAHGKTRLARQLVPAQVPKP